MEYYTWVTRILTKTVDTAAARLQQLTPTAVRTGDSLRQCEAASLGILSLARDVIFASILLLYKLLVIAYRYSRAKNMYSDLLYRIHAFRMTIGMKKVEEETTVPDLIKSSGYKVYFCFD